MGRTRLTCGRPLDHSAFAQLSPKREDLPRGANGHDALTGTERRVAELAALGLTTPEIAQRLYLSPKTVDWHLGHAYQKLGVSSRRQLTATLGDAAS